MAKPQVVFAPGCFDGFDGTQEELDELVKTIQEQAESGELLVHSQALSDEEIPAELEDLIQQLFESNPPPRTLH